MKLQFRTFIGDPPEPISNWFKTHGGGLLPSNPSHGDLPSDDDNEIILDLNGNEIYKNYRSVRVVAIQTNHIAVGKD